MLDDFKPKKNCGIHFEEEYYSESERALFEADKEYKVKELRRLLMKDANFSYNGLDLLIEHYINSTINYIITMNIRQRAELINAYLSVRGLICSEYKSFYERFVSSNLILVNKIEAKDRITFDESLEEYATKLRNIESKYSFSAILKRKLEMKLNNKKKNGGDIRHIEQFLIGYINTIANRGLSHDEISIDINAVIDNRCREFDNICSSSLTNYRAVKRAVSTLERRYKTLRPSCGDRSILREMDELLSDLESSLKVIDSFDSVLKKIAKVTLMLEKIRFKSVVVPKIDRKYNSVINVINNKLRNCRNADRRDYLASVSSSLEKIYNMWIKNLNLSAFLLVELFGEIDINDREKTDRILRFLNYSASGIFVRRKESCPSDDDSFGFYILAHAGLNNNDFLIYQINSTGEVKSCSINADDLFEFYLPLDEVVFLNLKCCFRPIDFDGNVFCDDISNGYFLLCSKDGYDISVGENRYSYNIVDTLSTDSVNMFEIFTSVCDFVRMRFKEYKNKAWGRK